MKKNYFFIMLVLGFYSCKKESSHEVVSTQVDVYVAGTKFNGTNDVSVYWKNGNQVMLSDGSKSATASSIFVSGNDVYVCGGESNGGQYGVAKYWKNGSPVALSDGSIGASATSIAVSGNDVYVAGDVAGGISGHAVYWKNGKLTYLPENTRPIQPSDNYPISSIESRANSIFISGSDIYIAGEETISKVISPYPDLGYIIGISALYWKNGNAVYLILGSYYDSYADEANSIFVAGLDVYACGALEARYWKNGNSFYLPGSTGVKTIANSIFVAGGDVYVAGTQKDGQPVQGYNGTYYRDVAKYWKNGIPVNLTDGSKDAFATSIAVSGNDVYVAGYEENTAGNEDYVAKYWKNGSPVILGEVSKESEAYSIFLAKK